MKKKYLLMVALAAAVTAACDMDKEPYDSLPDKEALKNPSNFEAARVGLYSGLKASTMGAFYNAPDIQCDEFHAVTGFSNTYGEMYRWSFSSQTTDFEGVYGNYQGVIARANFIIDGYNKADLNNKNLFPEQATQANPGLPMAKAAKGDAFFSRAFCLFGLSQYFCAAYDPATADQPNTGVSYRLDYAPSINSATYPARASLKKTYEQIYEDLDSAAMYVVNNGEANDPYISVDAITALRARVALAQGNYELAASEAELLIGSGIYQLANNEQRLTYLWQTSSTWQNGGGGNETIFLLATMSSAELPAQTGLIYLPYSTGGSPSYVPTQDVIDLYSDDDYRKKVYFEKMDFSTNTGATGSVYAFNKYIDQGILYQATNYTESARFCIEPRVFRIAEMYLIAAEAYAQLGDLGSASYFLNELKRNRIAGYSDVTYSGIDDFMEELRNERQRELLGEGMRLFDLKRWHMPMKRGKAQQRDICLLPGVETTDMSVSADNYRLTWPIPKHETSINPQVKQNPGY